MSGLESFQRAESRGGKHFDVRRVFRVFDTEGLLKIQEKFGLFSTFGVRHGLSFKNIKF